MEIHLTIAGQAYFGVELTPELVREHIEFRRKSLNYLAKKRCLTSYHRDVAGFGKKVDYHLDALYTLAVRIEKELPHTTVNMALHAEAVHLFNHWKQFFVEGVIQCSH